MSPLVTRPSLPEPGTAETSISDSAAILRTEGASGATSAGFATVCGRGRGSSAAAVMGAVVPVFWSGRPVGAGEALPGAAAPSLIWPSSAPTATVSPSLAAISASTPAAGAGTSIVTLSVSSSTSGSSTATGSPGFLNHLPMVASVTDSPSAGTRISAMVCTILPSLGTLGRWADHRATRPLAERLVEQGLELLEVLRHLPGRRCRRGRAPRVSRLLVSGRDLAEPPFGVRLHEGVGAHVARLLLTPHEFCILEATEFVHQGFQRNRIELLDAQQIDVVDLALLPLLMQVVIDFARAQHHPPDPIVGDELDLLVREHLCVIPKQTMERRVRPHLGEPRHRAPVAQQ